MDLVCVYRLEDLEHAGLLVGFVLEMNLDADQGRPLAQRVIDALVGLPLVSHRGFEGAEPEPNLLCP